MLHFRFSIYKEDRRLSSIIGDDLHDISDYDFRALHFGAFENDKLIAYVRFVLREPNLEPFSSWLSVICSENNFTPKTAQFLFPFQQYHPDREWQKQFLSNLQEKKIGELGKLAVDESHRNTNLLATFLEAFMEHCADKYAIVYGFGSCSLALERYYLKMNFERVATCETYVYKQLPEAVLVCFQKKS